MKNTPSNTIYLSNLSYKRDQKGIERLCSRYGIVKKIKVIVEPRTLQSRGMAFIEMGSIKEAAAAIEGLNGQVIDGRTLKANYAIPQAEEAESVPVMKKVAKKMSYKETQLAKKERNEKKRNSNPLKFKTPKAAKKVVSKKSKKD